MKKNIRFRLAMFMGKMARFTQRLMGMNASFFPGKIAIKICPDFLGRVDKPEKIIAVTGTNGKSTVTIMLNDILKKNGYKVMCNYMGSNVNYGIASTFIEYSTFGGKAKKNIAVLEIDERSSKLVYRYVKPTYLVCTNLFRDSIQRNANAEFIFDFMNENIPPETTLVLNADDMISSELCADRNKRVYYSINRIPTDTDVCENQINDCRICPKCHKPLTYDYVRYHHIGKAHCDHCGYSSKKGDYTAELDFDNRIMNINAKGDKLKLHMISDSVFNCYNELCVTTVLRELGLSDKRLKKSFDKINVMASRYTETEKNGIKVVTHFAKEKNPIALSIVFNYVRHEKGNKEVILMLDDIPYRKVSTENTTWIYDTDFEFLNQPDITNIVITGARIEDIKMRLLMTGIDESKLRCVKEETEASKLIKLDNTDAVYVLHALHLDKEGMKVRDDVLSMIEKQDAKPATKKAEDKKPAPDTTLSDKKVRIEYLYSEFANLFADPMNIKYLRQCLPNAEIIETKLSDEPAFLKGDVDLVYMGSMTEKGQEWAAEALLPYKEKIKELTDQGKIFLFTGNAMEIAEEYIERDDGSKIKCLGIFHTHAKREMMRRFASLMYGKMGDMKLVGFKCTFSHSFGNNKNNYFFDVIKGPGINPDSKYGDLRKNNFIATYYLGPFLVLNPQFTKYLLSLMGIENARLAHEETAIAAYNERIKDFENPNIAYRQ